MLSILTILAISWAKADDHFCQRQLTTKLSHSTFLLSTGTKKVVYRLAGPDSDIRREIFAQEFIALFPHLHSSHSRDATTQEITELEKHLSEERTDPKLTIPLQATVTPYYDLQTGADFLRDHQKGLRLRRKLIAESQDANERSKDYANDSLTELWAATPAAVRDSIIAEFKSLVPPSASLNDEQILNYWRNHKNEWRTFPIGRLEKPLVERLPPKVLSQLADLWAALMFIAIPDFHPRNWLITRENQIVAIDLAIPAQDLGSVDTLVFEHQRSPLKVGSEFSVEDRARLLALVSPEMKLALDRLDRTMLLRAARNASYNLNEAEIQRILNRKKYFFEMLYARPATPDQPTPERIPLWRRLFGRYRSGA